MAIKQFICIQFVIMLILSQILVNPVAADSSDAAELSGRQVLPSSLLAYENGDQLFSNDDNYETLRQHFLNKFSKRRAQAKANLAGLWGVPTRFA